LNQLGTRRFGAVLEAAFADNLAQDGDRYFFRLDGTDVVLLVLRDGGSAQMRIPAAAIRDVKVRRDTLH
jgi:hypothetical protein